MKVKKASEGYRNATKFAANESAEKELLKRTATLLQADAKMRMAFK